jgi:protein SCO1/2
MIAIIGFALAACSSSSGKWSGKNITGSIPDLHFSMTRASDGKAVTEADFSGKVTLLYFGYTYCPDVCPLTLTNISQVLKGLGKDADSVRVLFVTVDPNRDTLDVLKEYASAFVPQVVGLRGTPDQLAALAKRYRVAYSVTKAKDGTVAVTHSPAVYAFDKKGKARLLYVNLSKDNADTDGMGRDLKRIISESGSAGGFFSWL